MPLSLGPEGETWRSRKTPRPRRRGLQASVGGGINPLGLCGCLTGVWSWSVAKAHSIAAQQLCQACCKCGDAYFCARCRQCCKKQEPPAASFWNLQSESRMRPCSCRSHKCVSTQRSEPERGVFAVVAYALGTYVNVCCPEVSVYRQQRATRTSNSTPQSAIQDVASDRTKKSMEDLLNGPRTAHVGSPGENATRAIPFDTVETGGVVGGSVWFASLKHLMGCQASHSHTPVWLALLNRPGNHVTMSRLQKNGNSLSDMVRDSFKRAAARHALLLAGFDSCPAVQQWLVVASFSEGPSRLTWMDLAG